MWKNDAQVLYMSCKLWLLWYTQVYMDFQDMETQISQGLVYGQCLQQDYWLNMYLIGWTNKLKKIKIKNKKFLVRPKLP